jgi:hypothetical protein
MVTFLKFSDRIRKIDSSSIPFFLKVTHCSIILDLAPKYDDIMANREMGKFKGMIPGCLSSKILGNSSYLVLLIS